MNEEPISKSDVNLEGAAAKTGIVHSWVERHKTGNWIVIFLLVTGAIIGLGNLVTSIEAVRSFIAARFESPPAPTSAQATKAQPLTQSAEQNPPPVDVLLADGKTVQVSWTAKFEVMPKDAPMYAVEFDGMADVKRQLEASFKRDLLRITATVDSKRLAALRVELENSLADELRKEFGPRGVTVQSISLGELVAK